MRKGIFIGVALLAALAGCDDSGNMSCPDKGQDFFDQSVKAYFKKHTPAEGIENVKVLSGATYDTATNWWVVPVDVGKEEWYALLSCDGHLELSGRK